MELEFFSLNLIIEADEMLDFLDRDRETLRHLRLEQIFLPRARRAWLNFLDGVRDLGLTLLSFEIQFRWGPDDPDRPVADFVCNLLYISSARLMAFLEGKASNPLRLDLK